jgi:disulfide bond formation protein DsbB
MSVSTMSVFFALLAVAAQAGTVAVVTSRAVREMVRPHALQIAWLVATVATAGSLYYSEVAGFVPCQLCWYQRIAMYPLSAVLAVAAIRRDSQVWRYVLPLTVVGAVIATYHYQLQRFPSQSSVTCDADAPCTVTWVWEFHYISIPMMALTGFLFITTLVLLARGADERRRVSA